MNEVKILGKSGYDDGYYWDYRIDFEYKGNKFKYIDVGSGSGYFLTYRAIMMLKGDEEFLEGYRDIDDFDEPDVDPDTLKEYAEICMANDGEFVFEDDWDELDETYEEEEDE